MITGCSRTFPPPLPSVWPPVCYRVTPWLWAKWGRAAEEFGRTGWLQRTASTIHRAQQVPKLWGYRILGHTVTHKHNLYRVDYIWIVLFYTEIEKSQPVNIPDTSKRKKKKRTRATDSSTGTFDGNESDIIVNSTGTKLK